MSRFCPDCDTRTEDLACPNCGTRTLRDRQGMQDADPMLDRVLDGRYRLDSLIGRGGMGSVYKGVQLATQQTVAVKLIRADIARDVDAAKRFHREARAASLLAHPHTIRVMDFGESEDGDVFMVLEYLSGRNLAQEIRANGPLPGIRMAKIACEVAQSLAEAHAAGLAHRDLKPDNIMLLDAFGDRDFVKVLDFGIAKFLSGSSGESSVTRTGAVVGTPQYMAPEQAKGLRGITSAVDVYALGIILFQGLTGRRPFDGETPLNVLLAHVREPVPVLPPDCDASDALRELVRRMLAKEPADRPTSAEAMIALDAIRSDARVPTPLPAPQGGTATVALPRTAPRNAQPGARDRGGPTLPEEPGPTRAVAVEPGRAGLPRFSGRRLAAVVGALSVVVVAGIGLWQFRAGPAPGTPETVPALGSAPMPEAALPPQPVPVAEPVQSPGSVPAQIPPATGAEAPARSAAASDALTDAALPSGEGVPIRFESSPAGAQVFWGGRKLGATPFAAVVPGAPGGRTFVFRREGFLEGRTFAEVAPGAVVRLELVPLAPAGGSPPAASPAGVPVRPTRAAPRRSGVTEHW